MFKLEELDLSYTMWNIRVWQGVFLAIFLLKAQGLIASPYPPGVFPDYEAIQQALEEAQNPAYLAGKKCGTSGDGLYLTFDGLEEIAKISAIQQIIGLAKLYEFTLGSAGSRMECSDLEFVSEQYVFEKIDADNILHIRTSPYNVNRRLLDSLDDVRIIPKRELIPSPMPGHVLRVVTNLKNVLTLGEQIGKGGFGTVFRVHGADNSVVKLVYGRASTLTRVRQNYRLVWDRCQQSKYREACQKHLNLHTETKDYWSNDGINRYLGIGSRLIPSPNLQPLETLSRHLSSDSSNRREDIGLFLPGVLELVRQWFQAVRVLSHMGIAHNDISIANILIDGDRLLLHDFDTVTRCLEGPVGENIVSKMPPEMQVGKPVPCESDLWTLGVVLLKMVTGRSSYHFGYQAGEPTTNRTLVSAATERLSEIESTLPSGSSLEAFQQLRTIILHSLQCNSRKRQDVFHTLDRIPENRSALRHFLQVLDRDDSF